MPNRYRIGGVWCRETIGFRLAEGRRARVLGVISGTPSTIHLNSWDRLSCHRPNWGVFRSTCLSLAQAPLYGKRVVEDQRVEYVAC
jgi:hypothetical protein